MHNPRRVLVTPRPRIVSLSAQTGLGNKSDACSRLNKGERRERQRPVRRVGCAESSRYDSSGAAENPSTVEYRRLQLDRSLVDQSVLIVCGRGENSNSSKMLSNVIGGCVVAASGAAIEIAGRGE